MIKNYSEMTKIPLKAKSLKLVSIGLSFHNSFFYYYFQVNLGEIRYLIKYIKINKKVGRVWKASAPFGRYVWRTP